MSETAARQGCSRQVSGSLHLNKEVLPNKTGGQNFRHSLAATEYDAIVNLVDDHDNYGLEVGLKNKKTRKPIYRLVVGDPKHFGSKTKGLRGGVA